MKLVGIYHKNILGQFVGKALIQIPNAAGAVYGAEVVMAGFSSEPEAVRAQAAPYAPHVKFDFFRRGALARFIYLYRHAKLIDVLYLYNLIDKNYYMALLYMTLNPKGRLYFKADFDNRRLIERGDLTTLKKNPLKRFLSKIAERLVLRRVSAITFETREGVELAKKFYPAYSDRFFYLSNGSNLDFIRENIRIRSFAEKENLILSVARFGSYDKHTELLLQAVALTDLKGWKVVLVGGIEPHFQAYINHFFEEHPSLRSVVELKGRVDDKKSVMEWFNRCRIFLLTSRKESFSTVIPEALVLGGVVVTTRVTGSYEATDNEAHGLVVEQHTPQAVSAALQRLIDNPSELERMSDRAREYGFKNHVWSNTIRNIAKPLGLKQ